MLVMSLCMQFSVISVVTKYTHFATFSSLIRAYMVPVKDLHLHMQMHIGKQP
jgi:hypothetical protein